LAAVQISDAEKATTAKPFDHLFKVMLKSAPLPRNPTRPANVWIAASLMASTILGLVINAHFE
jgi:hypothetical protein